MLDCPKIYNNIQQSGTIKLIGLIIMYFFCNNPQQCVWEVLSADHHCALLNRMHYVSIQEMSPVSKEARESSSCRRLFISILFFLFKESLYKKCLNHIYFFQKYKIKFNDSSSHFTTAVPIFYFSGLIFQFEHLIYWCSYKNSNKPIAI